VCFFVALSTVLLTSVGFRDINTEGDKVEFEARIIEISVEAKALVVQRTPSRDRAQNRILVLVTEDTAIGCDDRRMRFDDLRFQQSVVITGLRVLEEVQGGKVIIVKAEKIELVE